MSRYPTSVLCWLTEDIELFEDGDTQKEKRVLKKDTLVKIVDKDPYGSHTVKVIESDEDIEIQGLVQHQLKIDIASIGDLISAIMKDHDFDDDVYNFSDNEKTTLVFTAELLKNLSDLQEQYNDLKSVCIKISNLFQTLSL